MIDGVIVSPMKQIPDNRGTVKTVMNEGDKFEWVYTTSIYKGIIKGWHGYVTKTLNYCVVHGLVKLVLFDRRPESKTLWQIDELYLGDMNYSRVTIPPGVLNAFQGVTDLSVVVVLADEVFDEGRMFRIPIDTESIPYDWSKVNK